MKQSLKLAILWLFRVLGHFRLARILTRNGLMIVCWHGVSLDDAHYNFVAQAAPILREFGMTATVYAVSSHLEDQLPNPNLLVRDALLRTPCREARLSVLDQEQSYLLHTQKDRLAVSRRVLNVLHQIPLDDVKAREQFARSVAIDLQIDYDDLVKRRVWHTMSPTEARKLSDEGFSIQLHGHRHCNVVKFPAHITEEVRVCRQWLEATLGRPAQHYCYPTGQWQQDAWKALKAEGVESAVKLEQGPNYPETPALALRRVSNGESRNQLEFEFELSNLRYLLGILLRPRHVFAPKERRSSYRNRKERILPVRVEPNVPVSSRR